MSAPPDAARLAAGFEGAVARLVGRPLFWILLVAAVASWPIASSLRTRLPPPLPVLAELPRFELQDQEGRPFGTRELEGRVWVASFIFTRCPTICPAITAQMARIQGRTRQLDPEFHLVSFSVDPAYDTPPRLAAYARAYHASSRSWSFLTGPEEAVRDAVVTGLKTSMGREPGADGRPGQIFHGSHLVLVDRRGRVRGYYDSGDEQVVDRVVRDAGLLVNRGS
jgi:protein SCO1/2